MSYLTDIVAAYYAAKGDTECCALNTMTFRDGLICLQKTQQYHQDLIELSKEIRLLKEDKICHLSCHVKHMIKREREA